MPVTSISTPATMKNGMASSRKLPTPYWKAEVIATSGASPVTTK